MNTIIVLVFSTLLFIISSLHVRIFKQVFPLGQRRVVVMDPVSLWVIAMDRLRTPVNRMRTEARRFGNQDYSYT